MAVTRIVFHSVDERLEPAHPRFGKMASQFLLASVVTANPASSRRRAFPAGMSHFSIGFRVISSMIDCDRLDR